MSCLELNVLQAGVRPVDLQDAVSLGDDHREIRIEQIDLKGLAVRVRQPEKSQPVCGTEIDQELVVTAS